MTTADHDILAIQRRRRQERRCVACGADSPRDTLCATCRRTLRYCPRCERIVPKEQAHNGHSRPTRSSVWCQECHKTRRRRQPDRDWPAYLAEQAAQQHTHLRAIVRLYRKGLTLDAIGARLSMPAGTVRSVIAAARRTGRWPQGLSRTKGWRKKTHA